MIAMPTSSIFQQVVIETPEEAERFVDALWESYLDVTERGLANIGKGYRMATREEIEEIAEKIKMRNREAYEKMK